MSREVLLDILRENMPGLPLCVCYRETHTQCNQTVAGCSTNWNDVNKSCSVGIKIVTTRKAMCTMLHVLYERSAFYE